MKMKEHLKISGLIGALCGILMGVLETGLILAVKIGQFSWNDSLLLLGWALLVDILMMCIVGIILGMASHYILIIIMRLKKEIIIPLYSSILSMVSLLLAFGYWWKRTLMPYGAIGEEGAWGKIILVGLIDLFVGAVIFYFIYRAQKKYTLKSLGMVLSIAGFLIILAAIASPPLFQAMMIKDKKDISGKAAPNIILITIDTLRADHLSCYGYKKNTSPNIDTFSKEGVLFENVIAQESQTNPSHLSILTSKYPLSHGSIMNGQKINGLQTLLSERLSERGYRTAGFVSSFTLDSTFGFNRGFEIYDDDFFPIKGASRLIYLKLIEKLGLISPNDSAERKGNKTNDRLFPWLERHSKAPFFLWVHYMDPHHPYAAPYPYTQKFDRNYKGRFQQEFNFDLETKKKNFSEQEIRHITALYDGEINFVDHEIGELFNKLKTLNLYHNSIIILTADHGEELGEHGFWGHTDFLYDGTIKIPLIFKFEKPIFDNRRIPKQVQSIDILPTLFERLGIKIPKDFQGRSLMELINQEKIDFPGEAFSETHAPAALKTKYSIRNQKWKYIVTAEENKKEFYDIEYDPGEQNDLTTIKMAEMKIMAEKLNKWMVNNQRMNQSFSRQNVNKEIIDKLKNLGYFQ